MLGFRTHMGLAFRACGFKDRTRDDRELPRVIRTLPLRGSKHEVSEHLEVRGRQQWVYSFWIAIT